MGCVFTKPKPKNPLLNNELQLLNNKHQLAENTLKKIHQSLDFYYTNQLITTKDLINNITKLINHYIEDYNELSKNN